MKNVTILNDLNTLNKLHASSVESYTTNNGIADFTCDNNGYVANVVIEGETLVNLVRNNLPIQIWYGDRYVIDLTECGYLKGTYTIFNFSNKKIYQDIGVAGNTNTWLKSITIEPRQSITFDIVEGEQISNVSGAFIDGWENNDTSKNEFRKSIIILEGNHTNKPISYFEGLKSVGQGDKIEVLTTPIHNNLIPQNYTKGEGYWNGMVDVGSVVSDSNWYRILEYIPVKPNTQYTGLYTGTQVVYYDENKNTIYHNQSDLVLGYEYHIFTTPQNAKYIRVSYPKDKEGNICIFEGVKHDKKQISTTLRSLPNGVKDTIEKRGNKYVKVQRCGEVALDGNVDVPNIYKPNSSLNYHRFLVSVGETPNFGAVCCDRFGSVVDYEIEKDNILADKTYSGFFITLHNDKTGGTREGFKTWLQANPITVVYELATPQIIELPNFNPQTYKGDNTLLLNSGVVQCDASFDACEGIRSELDVIKDKVSSLDDDYIVDIPIQYLNGWEGSLTCRVNGKCVTLAGMLHGQDAGIKSARTNILKLPINSKAISITTIGLYNAFGQYVGTVELTYDNEIKICHSDFTYNGNYIGLNLSWFLH